MENWVFLRLLDTISGESKFLSGFLLFRILMYVVNNPWKYFIFLLLLRRLDTIGAETDGSTPLQINKSPLKIWNAAISEHSNLYSYKQNSIWNTNQNVECHIWKWKYKLTKVSSKYDRNAALSENSNTSENMECCSDIYLSTDKYKRHSRAISQCYPVHTNNQNPQNVQNHLPSTI